MAQRDHWITGANTRDYHFKNVRLNRDFNVKDLYDVANVEDGDPSPFGTHSSYSVCRGIEVGHIFKLGRKYSHLLDGSFQNQEGNNDVYSMGCYGIGVGRTVAAAIEQNHDEKGIRWPHSLAPFLAVILPAQFKNESQMKAARSLYEGLNKTFDVAFDDRDNGIGFKLRDADLMGLPYRVIIGKKYESDGLFEVIDRDNNARYLDVEQLNNFLSKGSV